MKILAGSTTETPNPRYPGPVNATGGSIEMASGASQDTSSGEISISTADAGLSGVSGDFTVKTGVATSGKAGHIGESNSYHLNAAVSYLTILPCDLLNVRVSSLIHVIVLVTGNSTAGPGGTIELVAGSSTEGYSYPTRTLSGVDGPGMWHLCDDDGTFFVQSSKGCCGIISTCRRRSTQGRRCPVIEIERRRCHVVCRTRVSQFLPPQRPPIHLVSFSTCHRQFSLRLPLAQATINGMGEMGELLVVYSVLCGVLCVQHGRPQLLSLTHRSTGDQFR